MDICPRRLDTSCTVVVRDSVDSAYHRFHPPVVGDACIDFQDAFDSVDLLSRSFPLPWSICASAIVVTEINLPLPSVSRLDHSLLRFLMYRSQLLFVLCSFVSALLLRTG